MRKPYGPRIDWTGQTKGTWTFLKYQGMSKYLVRCVCGTERVLEARHVGNPYSHCSCQKDFSHRISSSDLTGQTFGYWTVLGYDKKAKFLCRCVCGNENSIQRGSLVRKESESCGCKSGERNAISIERRLGRTTIDTARKKVIDLYIKRAIDANRQFTLTENELDILFSSNCFYCNQPPSNKQKTTNKKDSFIYSGIDRVNNDDGYTKDNTVSCCQSCNFLKHSRDQKEFLNHLRRLVYYQDKKRFDLLASTQELLTYE